MDNATAGKQARAFINEVPDDVLLEMGKRAKRDAFGNGLMIGLMMGAAITLLAVIFVMVARHGY